MDSEPIVVAVVVTFRRHDVVRATLRDLLAQPGLSAVVLVDNAGDLPLVAAPGSQPELIQLTSPSNEGFGAGLAIGMRYARRRYDPDYYWLMDDDSAPHNGALVESLSIAESLDNLGSVNTRAGTYRRGRIRHLPGFESGSARPTDWTMVDGALISRTAVEVAGVPRSDLFMMLEDFEYTTRLANAGFTNYQRAGSISTPQHLGSASDWRHYYQARNLLRISIERRSPWGVIGWAGREVRIQGMQLVRWRPRVILLRWRGAIDGIIGRMGRRIGPS